MSHWTHLSNSLFLRKQTPIAAKIHTVTVTFFTKALKKHTVDCHGLFSVSCFYFNPLLTSDQSHLCLVFLSSLLYFVFCFSVSLSLYRQAFGPVLVFSFSVFWLLALFFQTMPLPHYPMSLCLWCFLKSFWTALLPGLNLLYSCYPLIEHRQIERERQKHTLLNHLFIMAKMLHRFQSV